MREYETPVKTSWDGGLLQEWSACLISKSTSNTETFVNVRITGNGNLFWKTDAGQPETRFTFHGTKRIALQSKAALTLCRGKYQRVNLEYVSLEQYSPPCS